MVNLNMPSVFSEDLGTLSPRLHDLTTWLDLPECKLPALAVYSWISELLFEVYWGIQSWVNLLSVWYAFSFYSFAFSLSSAYQSISVSCCGGRRKRKKTAKLLLTGETTWVIPVLPFKISAFLWVCECIFCVTKLCDSPMVYCIKKIASLFLSLKAASQLSLYSNGNVYSVYVSGLLPQQTKQVRS